MLQQYHSFRVRNVSEHKIYISFYSLVSLHNGIARDFIVRFTSATRTSLRSHHARSATGLTSKYMTRRKRPASLSQNGNLDRSFYGPVYHVSQWGRASNSSGNGSSSSSSSSSSTRRQQQAAETRSVARAIKYGVDRTCYRTWQYVTKSAHRFCLQGINTTIPPHLTISLLARRGGTRLDAVPKSS